MANTVGKMMCSLLKFCGHCKRYPLTIRIKSKATTVEKLMVVNVQKKSNYKSYKKIEIGFCTENAPKDARAKASDKELMTFRLECRSFVIAVVMKLPTFLLPCSQHGGSLQEKWLLTQTYAERNSKGC